MKKNPVIYTTIEELGAENKLWYKYANQISKNKSLSDDMVSDMYLAIIEMKIKSPEKTFTKAYIYTTLKNFYLISISTKKKINIDKEVNIEYIPDNEYERIEEGYDALNFSNYVDDYLNSKSDANEWFDKTIFKYIHIEGLSIRELGRRSNIHYNILQSSVQKTKKLLIKKYKDNG